MKLNVTLHHQCVDQIEWHTPPSVWWWSVSFNFINTLMVVCAIWNWMTHTTTSVSNKLNDTHQHQCVNEIEWNTPPSVLIKLNDTLHHQCVNKVEWHTIQFHQHTDGGVYHSISLTHWWWCVSFNFINTLMVVCVIQFHQHTDVNDSHHHQCVDEIEWYTPPSVS
jgi:hypothetical protein